MKRAVKMETAKTTLSKMRVLYGIRKREMDRLRLERRDLRNAIEALTLPHNAPSVRL